MFFYLQISLFFVFGAAVGSFLNVVAFRSIHGGSIALGSSQCPQCKHPLGAYDLVPIVSFLALRGRCRYCSKSISSWYPVVEAASGLLFAFTFIYWFGQGAGYTLGNWVGLIYLLLVVSILIVLTVTDMKDGLLPNSIVLPGIVAVFLFKVFFLILGTSTLSALVFDIVAAVAVAFIFFLIVYFSNEKALGGGDIKLVFLIGIAVGWPLILPALFSGFLTGGIVAAMLLLLGRKRLGQTLPLGPFLNLGAFIAFFWGQQAIDIYLRTFL